MKSPTTAVPILSLPVFLLPDGIMRIKVYEDLYLQMLQTREAEQGFVILLDINDLQYPRIKWGSWVDIINFDKGEYGLLEIDVKCKGLVNILAIQKCMNNLHLGTVSEISHWSQKVDQTKTNVLSESLQTVFDNDIRLNEFYFDKPINNVNWVVARWLEILPINLYVKNSFVFEHNYKTAQNFVRSIILK